MLDSSSVEIRLAHYRFTEQLDSLGPYQGSMLQVGLRKVKPTARMAVTLLKSGFVITPGTVHDGGIDKEISKTNTRSTKKPET